MPRHDFLFEPALEGLPFSDFEHALARLPYASTERLGLELLCATGARIHELNAMTPAMLVDDTLYWKPGKNQKGLRKEQLPRSLITELAEYRRTHRVPEGRLLGVDAATFVRYFDRDARILIGGAWLERARQYQNGRGWVDGWRLHLKSCRKTFQTVLFAHFYKKYGDAGVALEWVAKRMRYQAGLAGQQLSAYHYLQDYTQLEVERWVAWLETGRAPVQQRLFDFWNGKKKEV